VKLSDSNQKWLLLSFLLKGYWKVFLGRLGQRLYSEEVCYGLKRDLEKPLESLIPPRIAFHIRPVENDEVCKALEFTKTNSDMEGVKQRISRLLFLEAGINTCYGAITGDGFPCYIQWLVRPTENEKMGECYGDYFPPLSDDEILLEGAFTPESFRGKGIMSSAMLQVSDKGKEMGARWAITYVSDSNTASLKGCFRAGFVPVIVRKASWRLFRQKLTFAPISESDDVFTLYQNSLQNKAFL
jgi:hypothetical protein